RLGGRGVENVNAQVGELITTGCVAPRLAFTELKFSNSMIEAWWRSLKHDGSSSTHWTASPRPLISRVLRPGTQHRSIALGVSRTDARRNVLWQRRRGSRRPDRARRRRARGGRLVDRSPPRDCLNTPNVERFGLGRVFAEDHTNHLLRAASRTG